MMEYRIGCAFMCGMLIQHGLGRADYWFGTKGFSLVQKQSVLLTETPPQPNLLFPAGSALKCTPSSPLFSISLCSSSLSLRRKLHLSCSPPPSSSALWAASSLRQTAPFMKSVTWAGLQQPGDAAGHPLTAQVLRESEECLSFSNLCLPLSLLLMLFFSTLLSIGSSVLLPQLFSLLFWSILASELREDHESKLCLLWVICWCCVFAVHLSGSWWDVEVLLLLVYFLLFAWVVHVWTFATRHTSVLVRVLFVCGSAVSVCSLAVLQECVERSCVGACRSYFRLSCDAAAAAFWCSTSPCPLKGRLRCR